MPTHSYRKRILHLDGHWNSHDRVRELAEKVSPGCELASVECGTVALKMIQKELFDLVIVDPWAPEVTGFTICRYVTENNPTVPVFFYARRALMNDRNFAKAAGAAAFFLVDEVNELVKAMAAALGAPKIRRTFETAPETTHYQSV